MANDAIHKNVADHLRVRRASKFHTYPNGGTVRSQALAMINDLNAILENIPEGSEVPPWVVMKISQCTQSINTVHNYINYYGSMK